MKNDFLKKFFLAAAITGATISPSSEISAQKPAVEKEKTTTTVESYRELLRAVKSECRLQDYDQTNFANFLDKDSLGRKIPFLKKFVKHLENPNNLALANATIELTEKKVINDKDIENLLRLFDATYFFYANDSQKGEEGYPVGENMSKPLGATEFIALCGQIVVICVEHPGEGISLNFQNSGLDDFSKIKSIALYASKKLS